MFRTYDREYVDFFVKEKLFSTNPEDQLMNSYCLLCLQDTHESFNKCIFTIPGKEYFLDKDAGKLHLRLATGETREFREDEYSMYSIKRNIGSLYVNCSYVTAGDEYVVLLSGNYVMRASVDYENSEAGATFDWHTRIREYCAKIDVDDPIAFMQAVSESQSIPDAWSIVDYIITNNIKKP